MLFPVCKTLFRVKETEIEHLSLDLVLRRKYRFSDMTNSTLSRFICCSNKISLEPGKEPEETHALLHGASFLFLVLVKIFRYRLERIRKAFQGKWKFESTT